MPSDASLYSAFQPPPPIDPLRIQAGAIQMRALEDQAEENRLQTEQRRRALADQTAVDTAVTPGAGLQDILSKLPGHLHGAITKQWQEADENAQKAKKAKADAAEAESDYFGGLASTLKKYQFDPMATDIVLRHAKAEGHDISQIEELIKADPTKLPQIAEALIASSPKYRGLVNTESANQETVRSHTATEAQATENAAQTGAHNAATEAQAANTLAETKAFHRSELANQARTQNREDQKFASTYGAGINETGQPLPENPTARAIADYRIPPPAARSLATGPGRSLMDSVMKINPNYDGTQFPARNRMRVAFTSGTQGQSLNSLNTAIEHLDQFADAAKALGNGQYQPINALVNWAKKIGGDSAPTNFEGIKTIMAGELASAFKKSGATDIEIHNVEASINGKQSPSQLIDYVTKIAIPALGSKAKTYEDQWKQTMGDKDPYSVYTAGAKAALEKHAKPVPSQNAGPQQQPIPGIPGGIAELRDGKWIRIQ